MSRFSKGRSAHYIYVCARGLSNLRPLVPTARIALSVSIEHDAMGEMKKVLVYLATAYRLMCRHHQNLVPRWLYLVKFFRNLLLGENNELKNRYMLIGYKDDENDTHTSTRTSTHASSIDIQPSSENVRRLVLAIGKEEMSVKSMMEAVGLKNRPNFMDYSLTPAIREGFVCMKYPANPHHPRQRYLLTVKGLMLLDGNNG